jgi:hypothetical protein
VEPEIVDEAENVGWRFDHDGAVLVRTKKCKSPRQMQLANALCRYVELAEAVALTREPVREAAILGIAARPRALGRRIESRNLLNK